MNLDGKGSSIEGHLPNFINLAVAVLVLGYADLIALLLQNGPNRWNAHSGYLRISATTNTTTTAIGGIDRREAIEFRLPGTGPDTGTRRRTIASNGNSPIRIAIALITDRRGDGRDLLALSDPHVLVENVRQRLDVGKGGQNDVGRFLLGRFRLTGDVRDRQEVLIRHFEHITYDPLLLDQRLPDGQVKAAKFFCGGKEGRSLLIYLFCARLGHRQIRGKKSVHFQSINVVCLSSVSPRVNSNKVIPIRTL